MATIGDKPITDFDDGSQYLNENSLFAMAYPKDGGYASGKISAGDLGEGMGTQVNFSSLNTRNKNLFGAINELAAASNTIGVAVSGTLTAGSTSITLSSAYIHTDSTIDVYTTAFGVNPTGMTVEEGSVTLTFDEQQSDLGVRIILRGYGVEGGGAHGTLIEDAFEQSDLIADTYIDNGNGSTVAYGGWKCTDFIAVTAGETLNVATANNDVYNCWYNSEKAMTSAFNPVTLMGAGGYGTITVPSGVSYFRMSGTNLAMEHTKVWREEVV